MRPNPIPATLLLGLLCLAPALALAFGPPAGDAAITPAQAAETIKKAVHAQGDISPHTVKALQNDPKAMEAIGRPAQSSAQSSGQSSAKSGQTPKSTAPIYGDIIIHR